MIGFDEAVALIERTVTPLGSELVPLEQAHNRVLAHSVLARIDSPRADVSAMDGYAIRDSDLGAFPVRLKLVGESFAGNAWSGAVEAGQCARIFTGAPVPRGADRVIMQENVERDGDAAIIGEHPGTARHIRTRGGDFRCGEELLPAGRLLDSRAIVAAAAADLADVSVHLRPRVRILSTGDELAAPGSAADRDDAIPESVSFGVAALAQDWGAQVVGRTRLRDELEFMVRAAAGSLDRADLVVVTGGASVGEKDFAKSMFAPAGLEIIFSKVAIKPGKPVWLGRAGQTLVMGLPGNPTSALVTARLLLAPLLCAQSGRRVSDALRWRTVALDAPLAACGSRETFHRARWAGDRAHLLSNQDSGAQKALAEADLLVRQRANAPAQQAGEGVDAIAF